MTVYMVGVLATYKPKPIAEIVVIRVWALCRFPLRRYPTARMSRYLGI